MSPQKFDFSLRFQRRNILISPFLLAKSKKILVPQNGASRIVKCRFVVQVIHVLIDDQCLFPEKLLEKSFFLRDFLCFSHLKRSSFLHDLLKATIVLQQQTV